MARERGGSAVYPGADRIAWASLPGGEDWILRPVIKGMCRYESLKDGTLDLADIALMNDALDVVAENQQLANEMTKD